jgi:hypothetical protein
VRFKETLGEGTDSDENIVIGWEEDQYELSPRDELCESKFPEEIVSYAEAARRGPGGGRRRILTLGYKYRDGKPEPESC